MNILDVWFDSGSSHEAVLSVRPDLTWPADIYLEGSDQHRGWFQSSLLVGLGTRGRPPYREVVTHGFIVAEDGRKMSKSLGNSIEPADIIKQSGADILRLWVSMADYTQEVHLSKEILARVVEAYRKIRNTLRYLLGNLYDFDPAVDAVETGRLEEVDRYILARYAEVGQRVLQRVRGVRVRHHLPGGECVRDARPQRVLRRRLEGSPLHFCRRVARAEIGADGDVFDGRRADAFDCADPVVHGRRALAVSSQSPRGIGAHRGVPFGGRARGVRRPGAGRSMGPAHRRTRTGPGGDRAAAQGQAHRQLPAGQGRAVGGRRRIWRCSGGTLATCRCCSSSPTWSCGRGRAPGRRPIPPPGTGRSTLRSSGRAACDASDAGATSKRSRPIRRPPDSATAARTPLPPEQVDHPQPEPPMTEASNEAVIAAEATRAEGSVRCRAVAPSTARHLAAPGHRRARSDHKYFVRANVPLYSTSR